MSPATCVELGYFLIIWKFTSLRMKPQVHTMTSPPVQTNTFSPDCFSSPLWLSQRHQQLLSSKTLTLLFSQQPRATHHQVQTSAGAHPPTLGWGCHLEGETLFKTLAVFPQYPTKGAGVRWGLETGCALRNNHPDTPQNLFHTMSSPERDSR